MTATQSPQGLQVSLLGPLRSAVDGGPVALGTRKQRGLLALLALNANRVVSARAAGRRALGREPAGNGSRVRARLRVAAAEAAPARHGRHAIAGLRPGGSAGSRRRPAIRAFARRSVARPAGARGRLLRDALELWRGPPLAELVEEPFARAEADRLHDLRLRALEKRFDADLALGHDAELVGELTT